MFGHKHYWSLCCSSVSTPLLPHCPTNPLAALGGRACQAGNEFPCRLRLMKWGPWSRVQGVRPLRNPQIGRDLALTDWVWIGYWIELDWNMRKVGGVDLSVCCCCFSSNPTIHLKFLVLVLMLCTEKKLGIFHSWVNVTRAFWVHLTAQKAQNTDCVGDFWNQAHASGLSQVWWIKWNKIPLINSLSKYTDFHNKFHNSKLSLEVFAGQALWCSFA